MYIKKTSFGPHPLGEPPYAVSKAGEDRTVFPLCSRSDGPRNGLNPEASGPSLPFLGVRFEGSAVAL